jgi:putative hydrolase of the HAD superfamily
MRQSGFKRIEAVSFDGDMTLWDFDKVMRHALDISLAELRRRAPSAASAALDVDTMIAIRNATAEELKGRAVNLEQVRYEAFRRTLAHVGAADDQLAADLNALYLKHRFEDIELYPDVIATLDALRDRYTIGLLSNGNGYPERCGLPDRFDFVLFAQDVGAEKPAPEIFLAACRQAGCTPRELMHVGDSLETDVAGANAVGAVSVWLNRDRRPNDTDITPDCEVSSLRRLAGILPAH